MRVLWRKLLQGKHFFFFFGEATYSASTERAAGGESLRFGHPSPSVLHFYSILFYFDGHAKLFADVWILALIIECVKSASRSHLVGLCFLSPM